jgi:hypothetical protein
MRCDVILAAFAQLIGVQQGQLPHSSRKIEAAFPSCGKVALSHEFRAH